MEHQDNARTIHSRSAFVVAIAIASIIAGMLFAWLFVKPIASSSDTLALMTRYIIYAVSLASLFTFCDANAVSDRTPPLCPFCGFAAAACTASAYLQIFGIPVLWLICGIAWFKIGCCMASCWGASREEQEMIVSFQLFSFARVVIAMSMPILIALLVNDALLFMASTHTASFW